MRIGNLHITWLSSRQEQIMRVEVREELRSPDIRASVAKMARSEVKNYLADLAEQAELPFGDAASFLGYVRSSVALAGAHELERRIFATDGEREQAERNLKLVDDAFAGNLDLADDTTWDQILSDEFEEVGPPIASKGVTLDELERRRAEPADEPADEPVHLHVQTDGEANVRNLVETGFATEEDLNIVRGEE